MNGSIVLGFAESRTLANDLATHLEMECGEIEVHRFPDGESRVRVPAELPLHVIICLSLDHPDQKLIKLILAADAARDNGAMKLTLVAPYLCYMRQDKAFHAGEAISQHSIGALLGSTFDTVLTVDPHLHRIERLEQAIIGAQTIRLTASRPIAAFIAERFERPLILGPDGESLQWVSSIAKGLGFDFGIASKERLGDRNVRIRLPEDICVTDRDVVLVDDMASTGRTMVAAAESVLADKPSSVSLIVTHALFVGDAEEKIRATGIDHIWSTDSIIHPTNTIALAPLLAEGVNSSSDSFKQFRPRKHLA